MQCTITIPFQSSRVGADFQVEIFDWNQLEQAKSLGSAKINVEDLTPLTATERTLSLSSEKRGNKGQIIISMVFQPEIIVKSRKSTSTFSAAGRTMTAIGSAPINAGMGVLQGVAGVFKRGRDSEDEHILFNVGSQSEPKAVHGAPINAGKAVLQGVTGVFKRGRDSEDEHIVFNLGGHPEPKAVPDIPGTQVSQPVGDGEHLGVPAVSSDTNGHSAHSEQGVLRVSVLDAKDLIGGPDVKPYAVLRIGEKEYKTKHTGKTVAPEWYVGP